MNEPCIITIGGDLGSGKSTVAKLLAAQLGTARYSTGDLQRRIAEGMGLTSLELNKLAETDPSIDRRIDSSTMDIAAQEPRVVFDSRLAWHFVPGAFKVYLTVDPVVGARRILNAGRGKVEEYESLDEAMARVTERRASEDKRFGEIYEVNMNRAANYDLIIDTSYIDAEAVKDNIVAYWRVRRNAPGGTAHVRALVSPKTPFPLPPYLVPEERSGFLLLRCGRHYYANNPATLEKSFAKTLIEGPLHTDDMLPAPNQWNAIGQGPEVDALRPLPPALDELLARVVTPEVVRAWEAEHGFLYPSYPPVLARP
jgi:CMP/dCMP kinase